MKKIIYILALVVGFTTMASAQDYSGLLKTVTLTNAVTDSVVLTIPKGRSAVTFKYDISKTSGTVAGTIALQYKLTTSASETWYTYNTYNLTDATANTVVALSNNPALKWRILTTKTGTSVTVHRYFLLYRQ